MTDADLLEKARKEYPIGTIYIPLGYEGHNADKYHKTAIKIAEFVDINSMDVGWGYIYDETHDPQWAQIVSKPISELDIARQIIYSD